MNKSRIQETLVTLYLRLNGYFTTGFIIHAPISSTKQSNKTQLDILAVRFPMNNEPERKVEPSPFLQVSSSMNDFLICEVKSKGEQIQFNPPIREDASSIISTLNWMGAFEKAEIKTLQPLVQKMLKPVQNVGNAHFPTVTTLYNRAQIRGVLASPERYAIRINQPRFLTGTEMFSFIWKCLRPEEPRDTCRVWYDFGLWGEGFEDVILYFKDKARSTPGNILELYKSLGAT